GGSTHSGAGPLACLPESVGKAGGGRSDRHQKSGRHLKAPAALWKSLGKDARRVAPPRLATTQGKPRQANHQQHEAPRLGDCVELQVVDAVVAAAGLSPVQCIPEERSRCIIESAGGQGLVEGKAGTAGWSVGPKIREAYAIG